MDAEKAPEGSELDELQRMLRTRRRPPDAAVPPSSRASSPSADTDGSVSGAGETDLPDLNEVRAKLSRSEPISPPPEPKHGSLFRDAHFADPRLHPPDGPDVHTLRAAVRQRRNDQTRSQGQAADPEIDAAPSTGPTDS